MLAFSKTSMGFSSTKAFIFFSIIVMICPLYAEIALFPPPTSDNSILQLGRGYTGAGENGLFID